VVPEPKPGFWRCRFTTSTYDRFGAWLEGVPNYFAATLGVRWCTYFLTLP
jgi:hypothetical protein